MGYFALQALQHRGQDGAGMVASSGSPNATIVKNLGLVTEVFVRRTCVRFRAKKMLIGHVRYATSGETSCSTPQPLLTRYADGFYRWHTTAIWSTGRHSPLAARCRCAVANRYGHRGARTYDRAARPLPWKRSCCSSCRRFTVRMPWS